MSFELVFFDEVITTQDDHATITRNMEADGWIEGIDYEIREAN